LKLCIQCKLLSKQYSTIIYGFTVIAEQDIVGIIGSVCPGVISLAQVNWLKMTAMLLCDGRLSPNTAVITMFPVVLTVLGSKRMSIL
jgi:hypothetical protein